MFKAAAAHAIFVNAM